MAQTHRNKDFDSKMGSSFEAYAAEAGNVAVGSILHKILDIQSRGVDPTVVTIINKEAAPSGLDSSSEVEAFTADGTPIGVAVNTGTVNVGGANHRDSVYTVGTGEDIRHFAVTGELVATYNNPDYLSDTRSNVGISFDVENQRFFVASGGSADTDANIITEFSAEGVVQNTIDLGAVKPNAIAYAAGHIFIGTEDAGFNVYSEAGRLLSAGVGDDKNEITDMAATPDFIYACYNTSNVTRIYEHRAGFPIRTNTINTSGYIAVDEAGTVFVTQGTGEIFRVYSAVGNELLDAQFGVGTQPGIAAHALDGGNTRIITGMEDMGANGEIFLRVTLLNAGTSQLNYAIYGSAMYNSGDTDINDDNWVNILSVRAIEAGTETSYSHTYTKSIPVRSGSGFPLNRTFEEINESWDHILLFCSASGATSMSAFSRGQS